MIQAIWDSFCRALIRFFDNRFMPKQNTNFYELEVGRLHKVINSFIEERRIPSVIGEIESSEELKPVMNPIETTFQKKMRLENESRAIWNQQLKEAREKIAEAKAPKSVEELEKAVGI